MWIERSTSCQRPRTRGVGVTMEVPLMPKCPQSDLYLSDRKSCLRVWGIRLPPYRTDPRSMNFDTILSRCNSFL